MASAPHNEVNGSMPPPTNFAFAFDIDGVLLRSSATLPGASQTLQYLHNHSIPFILLTNGGGKHEIERVEELSGKFGVPLSVENFVQSHTPFRALVEGSQGESGNGWPALGNKTVLVIGGDGDKVRGIAERYGFQNVITPADIIVAQPTIWPFNQIFTDHYTSTARPLPKPITPDKPSSSLKVDAILVFNDPRDWALDQQLIIDLLMSSNGILGTFSSKNGDPSLPNNGWLQDGQPKIFFSNPDVFWAAAYHLPRLGQGGFRASLEGLWREVTGGAELEGKTVIGKPFGETYHFAERVLQAYRRELLLLLQEKQRGGPAASSPEASSTSSSSPSQYPSSTTSLNTSTPESDIDIIDNDNNDNNNQLKTVYMIGDNPESDIRGANEFLSPTGVEWVSVLVKTGVFQGATPEDAKYRPTVVVEDVKRGVEWALEREGWVDGGRIG